MRIDLLTTELRVGGAERCVTELAIGLKAAEDSVRVISLAPLPVAGDRSGLVERLRASGIEPLSLGLTSWRGIPGALSKLRQLFQADRPDVLQNFLFHANVLGTRVAHQCGIRVCVGGIRVAEHRRFRLWLERRAVVHMHGLTCVSQSVADFAQFHLRPRPSCFVKVIPNGVDVPRFSQAQPVRWTDHGLVPGARTILILGRLHPQKGIDWVQEMAPRLLAELPSTNLVIVGEGPLERSVTATVSQLPPGRSRVLPWQEDVPGLLAAADLVLLPSRYEGMPNVVLEAMAAGKPVLATRVEGVTELLGEASELQTMDFGRTEAAIASLKKLMESPDLRLQLGSANQLRAETNFSVAAMVATYRAYFWGLFGLHRNR